MARVREFCTDDIALATYLRIEGHRHSHLRMKDRRFAEWVYVGNGSLHACVDEYQRGEAAVEPLAFAQKLHHVRSELYQFLRRHKEGTSAGPKSPINTRR